VIPYKGIVEFVDDVHGESREWAFNWEAVRVERFKQHTKEKGTANRKEWQMLQY
jgi:hypothetical protein